MYKEYFNFSELPFSIAPDPHFLYLSARHQEGLAHLLYGIENGGGFVVLTGEVGTGKTTLCHSLLEQLPEGVDIALILNPKLNSLELLANICDELGIHYDPAKSGLKDFTDLLNRYLLDAHARGRRTVLMIDEAQNLSLDVLEQIRLLTNLETSKAKLLQIVLVGQPELKNLLNRKELRQLNQRVTARYHLEALTLEETRQYIRHRLSVSGGDSGLFRDKAIRRIYRISKGIPRLINILCDRALLGAFATGVKSITAAMVNKAAQEALDLGPKRKAQILLFVFMVILVVAGVFTFNLFYPLVVDQNRRSATIDHEAGNERAHSKQTKPAKQVAQALTRTVLLPLKSVQGAAAATDVASFQELIADPGLTFTSALGQMLALWGQTVPQGQKVNCEDVVKRGFRCLTGRGSLKTLLGYDRPAILEFTLETGQKRHALLVGMDHGYPVLRSSTGVDSSYRLEDMLKYWQGYYMILWKSPLSGGMNGIYPGQSSPNVLWLREQLDRIDGEDSREVAQPQFFDRQLVKRVKRFQRDHHLIQDGIVGPKTIIYLQNSLVAGGVPKLKHAD